ncbi:hypothetical protein L596_016393 [Steinernema carpocapsae]|uniref:Uncharacterized protein n=1 Tax=Steinernema carpocapsae TaxID=34508 RepID=A0A4U5NIU1_STECR|nr:hypothetical protein L596_016393 [Steinernema carpocapsae]
MRINSNKFSTLHEPWEKAKFSSFLLEQSCVCRSLRFSHLIAVRFSASTAMASERRAAINEAKGPPNLRRSVRLNFAYPVNEAAVQKMKHSASPARTRNSYRSATSGGLAKQLSKNFCQFRLVSTTLEGRPLCRRLADGSGLLWENLRVEGEKLRPSGLHNTVLALTEGCMTTIAQESKQHQHRNSTISWLMRYWLMTEQTEERDSYVSELCQSDEVQISCSATLR